MGDGPEQSRPPEHILAEVRHLAAEGCKEVTLLGQTVNSYKFRAGDQTTRLSGLLAMLQEVEGLARIKFVTNFPKDMTLDLLEAVRDLPKVMPYLHVPAQSGSNEVLKRMKRLYTVEEYREMLQRIRETVPGAAVTSDFIVGFCGETEDDFQQTVNLVRNQKQPRRERREELSPGGKPLELKYFWTYMLSDHRAKQREGVRIVDRNR